RHWLRLREPGWRISLALNGFGAVATAVVVVIVGATKFTEGAWISVLAMLSLFAVFSLVHRHYDWFGRPVAVDGSTHFGAPDIPLSIIESPYRSFAAPLLAYIESVENAAQREEPRDKVTVILPTFVPKHWWERILHNRDVLRLKPFLTAVAGVRVIECPYRL